MHADERAAGTVRGWTEKAEADLQAASLLLRATREGPGDTAAFHAQQCAEKYIKALLAFRGIDFPKTHDISLLVSPLSERAGKLQGSLWRTNAG